MKRRVGMPAARGAAARVLPRANGRPQACCAAKSEVSSGSRTPSRRATSFLMAGSSLPRRHSPPLDRRATLAWLHKKV